MNRTVSRAGATIYKGVAIAWLAAVALWVLARHGTDGLLGAAILFLVALASLRLGGRETPRRKTDFTVLQIGPTDHQRYFDSAYQDYPENIFNEENVLDRRK